MGGRGLRNPGLLGVGAGGDYCILGAGHGHINDGERLPRTAGGMV